MGSDILFINSGNQKKTYQELSGEFTAISPPVWSLLLGGYLKNNGYLTAIYDVNVHGWHEDSPEEIIEKHKPSLIAIMVYGHHPSASTQTMPAASKIAGDIKKYNSDLPLIMVGAHPSALPERTLKEEKVDYVADGDGAVAIKGFLEYLKGHKKIQDIAGIWYRNKNEAELTKPAAMVEDLDKNFQIYDLNMLTDVDKYRAHNMHCFQYFNKSKKDDFSDVRSPYMTVYGSLGCPYSCSYCCINALFKKPGVRYWSEEKIINWVDDAVNGYGIKNIRFDDELFILNKKRVEKICDMLIERNYELNIMVYGRVDTINETLLKKMKKAGINWICLGIESAAESVRSGVNKNIKGDISAAVKLLQMHDIYVLGNFMFGLPDDNLSTMQETLNMATELNCEFVNFYSTMAYPGSRLYQEAARDCRELPGSWDGFSQHSYETFPLRTKHLTPREVLRFRDDAFLKYFKNEKYLKMIEKKFGDKVVNHIEKMSAITLKRKILEN